MSFILTRGGAPSFMDLPNNRLLIFPAPGNCLCFLLWFTFLGSLSVIRVRIERVHCDSVTTSVGLMGPTKLTPFAQTSQRWISISNDTTSNRFFHTYLINTIGHFPQMTVTGPSLQSKSDQKLYRRQSIHSNDIIVMLKNLFNLLRIKNK